LRVRLFRTGIEIYWLFAVHLYGHAEEIISEVLVPAEEQNFKRLLVAPFPFYNESIGTGDDCFDRTTVSMKAYGKIAGTYPYFMAPAAMRRQASVHS
jgi:hypothetical protein